MKLSSIHIDPAYTQAQATRWLAWLAGNMQRHGQTVFLIEELQLSWLPRRSERIAHWVLSIMSIGLISSLIFGLVFHLSFGLIDGLTSGLLYGLSLGLIGGLIFSVGKNNQRIETIESPAWSWNNLKKHYRGGLIKGAFRGLIYGLIGALSIAIIFDLIFDLIDGLMDILSLGLMGAPLGGLIGGLIGAITAGWRKEVPHDTTHPNEGIHRTFQSAKKGWLFGLLFGFLFALLFGLLFRLIDGPMEALTGGLIFGLSLGLIGALWLGGMVVLRHYILRSLIYYQGYGPWNYTAFLNYAVKELQFMQRVGGGYIFIHRMLLDHFADMEDTEKARARSF